MASGHTVTRVRLWAVGFLIWHLAASGIGAVGDAESDGIALVKVAEGWSNAQSIAGIRSWISNSEGGLGDPCAQSWQYVRCINNRVYTLTLGSVGISGSLGSEIFQLTALQELDLSNNNFSGNLPSGGGFLALQKLTLQFNKFSGSFPENFASTPPLSSLNISHNNFSGSVPPSLFAFRCSSFLSNPFLTTTGCTQDPTISSSRSSLSSTSLGIILGSVCGLFLLLSLSLLAFLHFRRKNAQKQEVPPPEIEAAALDGLATGMQLERYSLAELSEATAGFSERQLAGRGATCLVYKATLGVQVRAIKRWNSKGGRSSRGEAEFLSEVSVMSRAIHRRVLRVEGFCVEGGERLIVQPFMSHGSVADHLDLALDSVNPRPLDWVTRRKVAIGTAEGLAYLHESCDPKIIHRDIKAANVLLSESFDPVVADFGLAREGNSANNLADKERVRGTYGYLAPEYIASGITSEKTDIYAYGVFLLELLSGKSVPSLIKRKEQDERGLTLRDWAASLWHENRLVTEFLDPFVASAGYNSLEVELFVQTALECLQTQASLRPSMSACSYLLEGNKPQRRSEWSVDISAHSDDEYERSAPSNVDNGYEDSQPSFSFGTGLAQATSPR